MDKKVKLFSVVLAVLFPFIVFVSAIEGAVFDKAFYMQQMEANKVIENTGIYPPDMELVVSEILNYLKGSRENFDIQARLAPGNAKQVVNYVSIFNEKEITHMDDVRDILILFLMLRDIAMVLVLIAFLVLLKKDPFAVIKALFYGSVTFMGVFIIIGGCFLFNFNDTFILFHQLFFANDLWIMDPSTDRLIWIVPEPFFFNLIGRMVLYILFPLGLTGMVTGIVLYRKRRQEVL